MKVIRNTKWNFLGISEGLLKFGEVKYNDSFILLKECKYVDVSRNRVYIMQSEGNELISSPEYAESNNSAGLTHSVGQQAVETVIHGRENNLKDGHVPVASEWFNIQMNKDHFDTLD